MADFDGDTTCTTSTVRFSDTVSFLDDDPEKKIPANAKKQRISRRERRNNEIVQQKAQKDTKIKLHENFEIIKSFADQLTPERLAREVRYYERMEGIENLINGVPNNGEAPFSPISYCSDCVKRISTYFKDENLAKTILKNDDDGIEHQVYIKDIEKLATLFLNVQCLHFYDHVTVEAFNDYAMKRGGSKYGIPLSIACLADAANGGSGHLYEKLAGKETVCAAFSTGMVMQYCDLTSEENSFKTHKQLLKENVDLDTIRNGCSCLKSDGWLKKRVIAERKMEKIMETNNKNIFWKKLNMSKKNWNLEDCDSSFEESEEETDEEEKDDEFDEKEKNSNEEEKTEKHLFSEVEDDFRPGNLVQPVEKEEDFDNQRWSHMRTTSSCLALCRHAPSCVVNAINKVRVLESLMLVHCKNEEEGVASTTPEEYFTVIAKPNGALIFSLGATVYEALARQSDNLWNVGGTAWSSKDVGEKDDMAAAKVYTTVHTVAAPIFGSVPVCHIDQQNQYGYYKTFRICIPGNFSGYYNDTSIGWRSELYSRITCSAAETECRGDKKSHYSILEEDEEFVAWPRPKLIRIEGGIVYDDSGDKSGNYLYNEIGSDASDERTAAIAYANMRNLTAVLKNLKELVTELLTGPFKKYLVELKTLDIERAQAEEAARGDMTVHETQHLNDIRTNIIQNIKSTAQTIEKYGNCLKYLERNLGTMNKYLSYNLKGYTAAVAASRPDTDDVYAFYV